VLHFRAFARVPRMLGYGHRDPVLISKSSIVLFCAEPRPAGRSLSGRRKYVIIPMTKEPEQVQAADRWIVLTSDSTSLSAE